RLQQSKQKPGVNTATLNEAIQQTLSEIRAINYSAKDPEDLVGSELYGLLAEALGHEACSEMLKKVFNSSPSHHHHRHHQGHRPSSPINFTNFNAAAAAAAASITQPVGFLVNHNNKSANLSP